MDGFLSPEEQAMQQQMMQQQILQEQMMVQQQMMQEQMMQQSMQNPMMQQQMYGYSGAPKMTKNQILQYIQENCWGMLQQSMQTTGFPNPNDYEPKMEKIDEAPNAIKHACKRTGVILLPKLIFTIPSEYGMLQVPHYLCQTCGKLLIYTEFM